MFLSAVLSLRFCFFFFNDTATTEIYTLSLHDALPIFRAQWRNALHMLRPASPNWSPDRKSTRLNSSHITSSYAVFCLKKKKKEGELNKRIEHEEPLRAQNTNVETK